MGALSHFQLWCITHMVWLFFSHIRIIARSGGSRTLAVHLINRLSVCMVLYGYGTSKFFYISMRRPCRYGPTEEKGYV